VLHFAIVNFQNLTILLFTPISLQSSYIVLDINN